MLYTEILQEKKEFYFLIREKFWPSSECSDTLSLCYYKIFEKTKNRKNGPKL